MHLSKDKKIYLYFFLLLFLGSINNKSLINNQFFKVQNLALTGLNENEKIILISKLNEIREEDIFFVSRDKIIKILNSNNLIESFFVNKNYPSSLNLEIKKTSHLANIELEGENFIIGSNKKLIKSESFNPNLPIVIGNPSTGDFFKIKENIFESLLNFSDLKKLTFYPSKRWDLELKDNTIIKLPIDDIDRALNLAIEFLDDNKLIDARIENQIILND